MHELKSNETRMKEAADWQQQELLSRQGGLGRCEGHTKEEK